MAETDALTGFFNQRYFHETLRREALRAQRYDRRLALLILDLDDFKAVNDRIGHLAGDAVLAQVAERLRNSIRSVDVGCRVGGDEFAVIMPESTADDAAQLFQRMHDGVATMSVPGGGRVRLSAGIAELRHGETAAGLFERADSALYHGEGAREGPRERRDGLRHSQRRGSDDQRRTATRRSVRDGRSGGGTASSVTPTRAPRATGRSSGTARPVAENVATRPGVAESGGTSQAA